MTHKHKKTIRCENCSVVINSGFWTKCWNCGAEVNQNKSVDTLDKMKV